MRPAEEPHHLKRARAGELALHPAVYGRADLPAASYNNGPYSPLSSPKGPFCKTTTGNQITARGQGKFGALPGFPTSGPTGSLRSGATCHGYRFLQCWHGSSPEYLSRTR